MDTQNSFLELTDTELESVCGGHGRSWYPTSSYNYSFNRYADASGFNYGDSGHNTNNGTGSITNENGNGGTANNGDSW